MNEVLFNDAVSYLNAKKVPFIIKTEYKDNKPHSKKLMGLTITKTDKFYRINGKIISTNFAKFLGA